MKAQWVYQEIILPVGWCYVKQDFGIILSPYSVALEPLWRDPTEAVKALQSDYGSQDFLNENTTVLIISFELPLRVVRTASGDLSVERHKVKQLENVFLIKRGI